MKIIIYSVDGCAVCESLRNKLKELSLTFTDIKCNGNISICDTIESMTGCEMYPMIKIETAALENLVMCIAKDHNQLGKNFKYQNSIVYYVHSINNMLDAIKKL